MKKNNQSISMLHPFSFSFYRRFGWETYVERKHYEMESDLLPARKPFKGSIERIHSIEPLMNVYEEYARRYNGTLVRSKNWWETRIVTRKKGQYAIYRNESGNIDGYMIYEVMNSEMQIHEFIALHTEAEKALWHYIAQHDSMIKAVKWFAPSHDQFTFMLDNPRIKQSIMPYFMARVVDVEAFIKQYRFKALEEEDTIYLNISDQYASWNHGYFELKIDKHGSAQIKKVEESNEREEIKMEISTLAALLLTFLKMEFLYQIERVSGDLSSMKRLQDRISERSTYLTDFF